MTQQEIQNDISVSSRIRYITDEEHLKIANFIMKEKYDSNKLNLGSINSDTSS